MWENENEDSKRERILDEQMRLEEEKENSNYLGKNGGT